MSPSQAIILRPGEGRAIDLGGFSTTVKATSGEPPELEFLWFADSLSDLERRE